MLRLITTRFLDQISNEDFLLDAQKFVKKPYHINDGKYKQFMNQARSNTRGRNEEDPGAPERAGVSHR